MLLSIHVFVYLLFFFVFVTFHNRQYRLEDHAKETTFQSTESNQSEFYPPIYACPASLSKKDAFSTHVAFGEETSAASDVFAVSAPGFGGGQGCLFFYYQSSSKPNQAVLMDSFVIPSKFAREGANTMISGVALLSSSKAACLLSASGGSCKILLIIDLREKRVVSHRSFQANMQIDPVFLRFCGNTEVWVKQEGSEKSQFVCLSLPSLGVCFKTEEFNKDDVAVLDPGRRLVVCCGGGKCTWLGPSPVNVVGIEGLNAIEEIHVVGPHSVVLVTSPNGDAPQKIVTVNKNTKKVEDLTSLFLSEISDKIAKFSTGPGNTLWYLVYITEEGKLHRSSVDPKERTMLRLEEFDVNPSPSKGQIAVRGAKTIVCSNPDLNFFKLL